MGRGGPGGIGRPPVQPVVDVVGDPSGKVETEVELATSGSDWLVVVERREEETVGVSEGPFHVKTGVLEAVEGSKTD